MPIAAKKYSNQPLTKKTVGLAYDFRKEFVCPEESTRYASSLEQLVFSKFRNDPSIRVIIEFGAGTGEPVISAILSSRFLGTVYGYEINAEAAVRAEQLIETHGLDNFYIVNNESFFESKRLPPSDFLIANPPYIPCDNKDALILPGLCGGPNGSDVSKKLLSSGYKNVFLEVSSYSDPKDVLNHARELGYTVSDFLITQLPFGVYSRQDIVQKRLHEMKRSGHAYFSNNCYLVGSALFAKSDENKIDLSAELISCLTAVS